MQVFSKIYVVKNRKQNLAKFRKIQGKNDRVLSFFYVQVFRWTGLLIDGYLVEIYLGFGINLRSRLMSKEKLHVIQNKDKNVIIKSTKCEKIFISWIHKVFKQIVSPFNSGCHLYSDRDQQTGNSCRYGNIRKIFILPLMK